MYVFIEKNRNITDRCLANFLVPYSIHSKENWIENVKIQNSIHSNYPEKDRSVAHFLQNQNQQPKQKNFTTQKNHLTRYSTYNKLLEYIRQNFQSKEPEKIKVNKQFL